MENIRDWCISRQLWWGHRIPVWYCDSCNGQTVAMTDPTACSQCGGTGLTQDPDVLDTWFSSALWPHSTLGWPEETEELRYFYPTTVMETAYDILFFWVARMIMMGLENTGSIPFHTVYLHGLIRDATGRQDEQEQGERHRPAADHGHLRSGRPAVRRHHGHDAGQRQPPGRCEAGGGTELREQAVER